MYMKPMNKNIEYYLNLPYTLELSYDPEQAWFIAVKELPGCTSQGDTPDEAVTMIKDAMQLWIEDALEEGHPIPEPRLDDDFSGKFNLRVPVSLHRKLSELADDQGVSLNTLCVTMLSEAVGHHTDQRMPFPVEKQASDQYKDFHAWPGLSNGVRRSMYAAGLYDEAGKVDERLFTTWFTEQLAIFQSAFKEGYTRDALTDLERLAAIIQVGKSISPSLGALESTLEILKMMVKQFSQPAADPIQQIREVLQQSFEPIKVRMTSESRRSYSTVASKTESSLAEQLFKKE